MKQYSKPIISIDTGMAEGVYAISGSTSDAITISSPTNVTSWSSTSGQATFNADLSKISASSLTLTLNFNSAISAGWCDGASNNISGQTLTLTWSNTVPSKAVINVQVNQSDINQLQCIGYSYSTTN